ncbi:Kiwa anti-phage protein KwaB-like domain-containing protein [Morganella morganii]|uniref:Kiwa anti-phage protein KwaB-like domain-containing protein n=1 Tax=Morganella morganii TaxID=582 RepID=UPI0016479863|nr:Kiwa anti-phage protein KwaB-like domain-containing protein [Morganella morganii]MBC3977932.1 DUF4868 domain-containing protein [Morganella morganii]
MPLFALMNKDVAIPIVRIETDKNTDKEVSELFQKQYNLFESHHDQSIEFYAGYSPRYNECFFLHDFQESLPLIDAINRNTAIPVLDYKKIPMSEIKCLFVGVEFPNNPNKIAIQTFNKSQILDVSRSLWASKNMFSMTEGAGFNLGEKLVAVIDGTTIKFKSFQLLRSIFDMEKYFSEATDNDVSSFCQHSKFKTEDGFDLLSVADTVVRTKITLINNSGVLDIDIKKLKTAAKKVKFDLKITTDSSGHEVILVPTTKKEIKNLLTFLDEDYFTSEISNTIYKSNSKRPMTS